MTERDPNPNRQGQQGHGSPRQAQQSQSQQDQGGVSGLGDSDDARRSGQQGGQNDAGQQRQLDTQGGGQQAGGSGTTNRFADQIREHQEVVDDTGQHVGTVDHVDGDRIKLARSDSNDGEHHYVSLSQVAGIEGDKVRLRERGDNDFGSEASR